MNGAIRGLPDLRMFGISHAGSGRLEKKSRRRVLHDWRPSAEQMALWPAVSGNAINGLGETTVRRPSPIYWQTPGSTPHSHLQLWFYARPMSDEMIEARRERQRALEAPLVPLAAEPAQAPPERWAEDVKRAALACGADVVGIARIRPEWIFEGRELQSAWAVMLGVGQRYDAIRTAPDVAAGAEVIRQYARGSWAAKRLANWIRQQGHDATPHSGPMSGPMAMIPAAIEAGLGELGKHGSLIHRQLGSNFRLAMVVTDLPLVADERDAFGGDEFCQHCRLCVDECPPQAIQHEKQWVRGEERWYVDFDRCLPFFNEHHGCAICVAVCPWSRPGVPANLLVKLAVKRQRG
jgi:epoxyqueuosine reductase